MVQLLLLQVEVEEEFLTNTLQKKLEKVGQFRGWPLLVIYVLTEGWHRSCPVVRVPAVVLFTVQLLLSATSMWCGVTVLSCCGVCCLSCAQLNKEKVDLENRLEAEQEYVVNKLCKQVRAALHDCSSQTLHRLRAVWQAGVRRGPHSRVHSHPGLGT